MTAYRFRAARQDGEIVVGSLEAASPGSALALVNARGLFPLELDESRPERTRAPRATADLAETMKGLAALLEAGLPMDRALSAVADSAPPRLGAQLQAACERVREGAALSAALHEAGALPPLAVGLLRAGERSGRVAAAAARAGTEMENEVEARDRLRAALTYPAFVAAAGLVSLVAIAGFVVPRFAELIGAQGRDLPAATRALLAFSDALAAFGPLLLVVAITAVAIHNRLGATSRGRLAIDGLLLQLPLAGHVRLRFASARVCAALGGLLEAGVPMLAAMHLAREAAGNAAIASRIGAAQLEVERGERLAAALTRHKALSPSALRLASFGESAGRLPAFLEHAARLEATGANRSVQRAVTLLEPVLIAGFGIVVAFVAAALFQAIYSVRPGAL